MRAVKQQRQRRSVVGHLAVVLAVVCLVELHLLLRPPNKSWDGSDDHSASRAAGTAALFGVGGSGSSQGDAQVKAEPPPVDAQQAALDMDADARGTAAGAAAADAEAAADPAAAAHEAAAAAVRGANIAFVTFGNGAFNDFISNWVAAVQRLGVPFLVGALDAEMARAAAESGWPHLDISALVGGNTSFFRNNFATFRNMGATKVQLVLTMLEDLDVQTVVVSDSDTVWLRDPSEYLDQHPTADWYISTDCLSHEVEREWKPWHFLPRCGHIPKNGWGRAFNTGVFAVRSTPAAREVLGLWRDFLLDPSRTTSIIPGRSSNTTFGITDQLALNILLEPPKGGPLPPTDEDPRVLHLAGHALPNNRTLRLHPLPVLLFASGHVAFVQRLPWRHGVDPYVVHATFQRYATQQQRAGKRGRFREFGMWFLDPPEYFGQLAAGQRAPQFLSYENDVMRVMSTLHLPQFPDGLPVLYKHLAAASYQLALFRDALAVAQMLNRTIVLPKSWCWCDYDWTPHVLEKCKIRGSDLQLPFECPADFVFHIPWMEEQNVSYRMPGFLEQPQVPPAVRRSRAEAHVLPMQPAQARPAQAVTGAAAAAAAGATAAAASPAGLLWPGMTQSQVEAAVQLFNETAVVHIRAMQPGLVVGFSRAEQNKAFGALFAEITKHLYWCCAAEGNLAWSAFAYQLPQPFNNTYLPWKPPVLTLPTYCDTEFPPPKAKENGEYVRYANHPCQFLRNATAARIAAELA